MKSRYIRNLTIIFFVISLSGCSHSYSSQLFSYPPESKPHENNWLYFGVVRQWEPFGKSLVQRGKRKVEVIVTNKNNHKVLEDSFILECASIHPRITWLKFEELTIVLYEEGNKFAEDVYNKELVKEGPRKLMTLTYTWNGNSFVK